MRKAAKRDENEAEIVKALRDAGYFVTHLNDPGVPDLLVIDPWPDVPLFVATSPKDAIQGIVDNRRSFGGINPVYLVEVKMPGKKLNKVQQEWHRKALGNE